MNSDMLSVKTSVVSASIRGAMHKCNGTCCQDAVSIKEGSIRGEPFLIASSADGHGGEQYIHSDQGSCIAIQSAEQTMIQFILSGAAERKGRYKRFVQYFRENLKEEWARNIRQVREAFRTDPETMRLYGTTLLSALIYRRHIYIAQLGDGDICMINRNGSSVFNVQPQDGPIESVTRSLCSEDAEFL